jgi:NAD(P)-dependent dehydrogenase (short-subunit alcohol dehydrogenase family)
MDPAEFQKHVALVTGGGRGIGRACCLRLAAGGAAIALNYRSDDRAARETRRLIIDQGGRCELFKADAGDEHSFCAAIAEIRGSLGPIGLLIANAGTTKARPHHELTLAIWRQTLRVNLDGAFLAISAVKDEMLARGFGRIVCVSSMRRSGRGLGRLIMQRRRPASSRSFVALLRHSHRRSASTASLLASRTPTCSASLIQTSSPLALLPSRSSGSDEPRR